MDFCCPLEELNNPFFSGSLGSTTLGGVTVGALTVTNNSGGGLEGCCPAEGVQQPGVSSGGSGSATVGPFSMGAITVSHNTVDFLDLCCPDVSVGGVNLQHND